MHNQFACLECDPQDEAEEADKIEEEEVEVPAARLLASERCIFVKHLDRAIDTDALQDVFGLLGTVTSCKVAGGPGKSRGYGFVHYATEEAAALAVARINGMQIGTQVVEVRPFMGAMVSREVAGIRTFVHYETKAAAMQAIRKAAPVAPSSRKVELGSRLHGSRNPTPASAQCDGFTVVGRSGKPAPAAQSFGARLAAAQRGPALSQRTRRQRQRRAALAAVIPGSAPDGIASRSKCLASVARGGRVGWKPSLPEEAEANHLACLEATRATLARRVALALGSLRRDVPGGFVGAVALEGGVLEAVIDSGAEESVAPPGFFAADVVPSPMSKAGGRYRAANGTRIRNLGQQRVSFNTAEGHLCTLPFQVAEVERPLISVAHLTSAGNRVILNDTGGQIVNATTGKTIELVRRGGVYLLLMQMGVGVGLGFPRQGST